MDAKTDVDQFAGWQSLQAGGKPEFNADEPLSGYFRTRRYKNGPMVSVAIWRDEDGLNVHVDGAAVQDRVTDRGTQTALEQAGWPYCAKNWITYEVYQAYIQTGRWPDIDGIVHDQQEAQQAERGMGDNAPPTDPLVILREQIEAASAGAKAYAKIADDETNAKAQTLRSRLLELSGSADKKREAEKAPHWAAAKAVDEKWNPLVKAAKTMADAIKEAMNGWENVKLARQREAERLHAEAVRKAEAEAAKAAKAGKLAPAPPPPPPPPPAPIIKGAAGRAASVSVKRVATEITEINALFNFFRLRPELSELLLKMAQADLNAGRMPPGIKVEEKALVK